MNWFVIPALAGEFSFLTKVRTTGNLLIVIFPVLTACFC